jgi:hypothetical protein
LINSNALLALVLSATFQLAPGTISAECRAWERHISGIGRFTETSEAAKLYCEIRGGEIWTARPIVGQVVIFSVRAVDPNGARSPWTGGIE